MSIAQEIEQQLRQQFHPQVLEVVNESDQHSVPANSETHFKVVIVAEAFAGARKVARHQQLYAVLAAQLAGPVHALALHAYTPDEWRAREQSAPASPACMGGSKTETQ